MWAKQSAAKTIPFGPVLDTSGLPVTSAIAYSDAKIFKNGTDGALDASATFTHKYEGVYALALTASDLDTLGQATIVLNMTNKSAAPVRLQVVTANIYDSIIGNTDFLQVDAVQIEGADATNQIGVSVPTAAQIRGEIDSNSTQLAALVARLTAARAGYLDKLNVAGVLAQQGDSMALTSGERTTLAAATEAAIINELDGEAVMQAIADLIAGDMTTGDLSVLAIASAVRANLATELGRIDAAISSRLATGSYAAPLDAAGTRTALGMAAADLDTQLDAILAAGGGDATEAKQDALIAAVVKVLAAVYDSASVDGNDVTLSNGAVQTVTSAGRATVEP